MEDKIATLGTLCAPSFSVDLDQVKKRNGRLTRRLVIQHPSAVSIIPLIGEDKVLLVTQYRYAVGRETLELPAGKLDPGESPQEAATRELAEETGYQARTWKKLLSFAPSVGYSTEIIHIFAARDLSPLEESPVNDGEIDRVETVSLSQLKKMIVEGRIIDGTTILTLAAFEWMDSYRGG